jgi:ADP-heptose:LPS heptosyltransferase
MNYIRVDSILWVFLQNSILLPNEYFIESEEYDIFINTYRNNKVIFVLSLSGIKLDIDYNTYNKYTTRDIYFNSFQHMISSLYLLLDDTSYKKT